ncbi:DUF262 domain-containing protein [Mogibacterium diversum]|uniref:DUF262 domain-containing protein n=1 Tax=Mogibacterium diversum TaxID=114527 RepID=UPI0028EE9C16|nr:DUF262 domain-containing protein [Mogibacterium diversum]
MSEMLKSLTDFLGSDMFAIPDYQRDYAWTVLQNETLFLDVISLMLGNEENHFMGAFVTVSYEKETGVTKTLDFKKFEIDESKVKHIIDGQQRLTSISILVKALYDTIKKYSKEKELDDEFEDELSSLKNILFTQKTFKFEDKTKIKKPRLILNGNTGDLYNMLLLDCDKLKAADKRYSGAKKLQKAYDKYLMLIEESAKELTDEGEFQDYGEYYKKFCEVIAENLKFVEIKCDKSTNAFQIFDSINGKGLDLTAADRIKSIFISWSKQKSEGTICWEKLCSLIGEKYLTHFFVTVFFYQIGKRISKNKLPDEFKKQYKAMENNFEGIYKSLLDYGQIYSSLRNPKDNSRIVNNLLRDLITLKQEQAYVLLFAVIVQYKESILDSNNEIKDDKEFIQILEALISFLVRVKICEKPTNMLDVFFSSCIIKMKENDMSKIRDLIKNKQEESVGDDLFATSFRELKLADSKEQLYYLKKIEEYLSKENKRRQDLNNTKDLTVEHIIPQNLSSIEEWYEEMEVPEEFQNSFKEFKDNVINSIGNMAILFGDDNSSAGNNNIHKKIGTYNEGKKGQDKGTPYYTFNLIREVVDSYYEEKRFTHLEVEKRAEKMSKYAVKVWK